jgi:hypothetical protein
MSALDRLVQKTAMTAEEIGRLRKAFELALREIGVQDRDDPLTQSSRRGRPTHKILQKSFPGQL